MLILGDCSIPIGIRRRTSGNMGGMGGMVCMGDMSCVVRMARAVGMTSMVGMKGVRRKVHWQGPE